jgi:hypothetical protein
MIEEALSRSERIGELYRMAYNSLDSLYEILYEQESGEIVEQLSDQLHTLLQMRTSDYTLEGYDPRFLSLWETVRTVYLQLSVQPGTKLHAAYEAAAEVMERWKAQADEVAYEAFLRIMDEEFAEARERNKDVQAGDTVVLLKAIWLYGEIDDSEPDVAFGTPVEVVHRGPAEGDTRDPQDYVTIRIGDLPDFSTPWTIVMPLALFQALQAAPAEHADSQHPEKGSSV